MRAATKRPRSMVSDAFPAAIGRIRCADGRRKAHVMAIGGSDIAPVRRKAHPMHAARRSVRASRSASSKVGVLGVAAEIRADERALDADAEAARAHVVERGSDQP